MKISARDHVTLSIFRIGDKDERVIDCRIRFCLENLAAMGERVADGAVDLRNAAQRVGVLHAAAGPVRFANLASFQHAAQIGCGLCLSGMRTRLVNPFVESRVGSLECVARQSTQYVG